MAVNVEYSTPLFALLMPPLLSLHSPRSVYPHNPTALCITTAHHVDSSMYVHIIFSDHIVCVCVCVWVISNQQNAPLITT